MVAARGTEAVETGREGTSGGATVSQSWRSSDVTRLAPRGRLVTVSHLPAFF